MLINTIRTGYIQLHSVPAKNTVRVKLTPPPSTLHTTGGLLGGKGRRKCVRGGSGKRKKEREKGEEEEERRRKMIYRGEVGGGMGKQEVEKKWE